jgi:hypothetical protein
MAAKKPHPDGHAKYHYHQLVEIRKLSLKHGSRDAGYAAWKAAGNEPARPGDETPIDEKPWVDDPKETLASNLKKDHMSTQQFPVFEQLSLFD